MSELIIFDGDGVLYDTEPVVCRIQADVLTALGLAITEHDARAFIGHPGTVFYNAMEERFGTTLPGDMNRRFVARYGEVLAEQGLPTMPGARELIARLRIPFCVATNSTRLRLDVTLKAAGIAELFAGRAFAVDDVARGKPAPDLFLFAAKAMGGRPADTLVIEDSVHGIAAARAAGMRVIGFTGGAHCGPDHGALLLDAGAETVCPNMDTVARLLANDGYLL